MKDVVLRCPHCGTTQAMLGECEACHEADVRYFCPNHSPGLWLDGAICSACGAYPARERTRTPAVPASPPAARRPAPRPTPSRAPFEPPARRPREDDPWLAPREPAELERMDAEEAPPVGWRVEMPPPPIRINPLPVLGCLGGIVRFVVMGLLLLAMATCWFMGGGGFVLGQAPLGEARPAAMPATPVRPVAG